MIGTAPPLRFLLLVTGGWVCLRGAVLVLDHGTAEPEAAGGDRTAPSRLGRPEMVRTAPVAEMREPEAVRPISRPVRFESAQGAVRVGPALLAQPDAQVLSVGMPAPDLTASRGPLPPLAQVPPIVALQPPLAPAAPGRWSASAWTHVRSGGGGSLAPGGMLGGSQAGVRISYSPTRSVAVVARAYAPLGRPQGAEAAIGVEWQPLRRVPVRLLAERRQRIGNAGRSDFAMTAHGGISEARLPGGLRFDAYGQAGVVGLERRDLFADGAARISMGSGPVDVGGGVWGAAQPGVARLDVGPSIGLRLPAAGTSLRVSADWRFRIAGDAAPGSGPSLTVAADF